MGRPPANRARPPPDALGAALTQAGAISLVVGPHAGALRAPPRRLVLLADGSRADETTVAASLHLGSALGVPVSVLCAPTQWGGRNDPRALLLRAGYASHLARAFTDRGIEVEWDAIGGLDPVASVVASVRGAGSGAIPVVHAGAWTPDPSRRLGRPVLRLLHEAPSPVIVVGGMPPPKAPPRGRTSRSSVRPPTAGHHPHYVGAPRHRVARVGPLPSDDVSAPVVRRQTSRGVLWALILTPVVVATVLAAGVAYVPSHYYSIRPGPTIAVHQRIVASGAEIYPMRGRVLMTTVEVERSNLGDVLAAWFGSDVDLVRHAAASPGAPEGLAAMADSKATALAVALDRVGLDSNSATRHVQALIYTPDVRGGSAGLAFTLGLIDLLTPADLTGGRIVAATGTIDPHGNVGPIDGIEWKTIAARDAGAHLFLVPLGQQLEARGHAGGMAVIGVSTIDEALAALGS
ncbi:MAG TPA: S16 family serine protease [Acidimicrobiales bacterium]